MNDERRGTVQEETGDSYPPTGRRNGDAVQDVAVDSFKNGAKKKIRRLELIAGSGLLALIVSICLVFWKGGEYVRGVQANFDLQSQQLEVIFEALDEHEEADDIRTEALAEGVAETTNTLAAVVAHQQDLQAWVGRMQAEIDRRFP